MNRIHIVGASGSGTTTLAKALSETAPFHHYDTDDYFWLEQYTIQRTVEERLQLLNQDLQNHEKWILSGSLCGWGDSLKPWFDLVVFLYIPKDIRLNRLWNRELNRYGENVLPGGSMYKESTEFMTWAARYDDGGVEVRSKVLHEIWLSQLSCPILRIEGDTTVEERCLSVFEYIGNNRK